MLVLIELNLDEKIVDKIKELLEDGTYENEKELIIRAIENLYERTKAVGDSTITVAVDHPIIQKLSDMDEDPSSQQEIGKDSWNVKRIFESRLDVGKLYPILEKPNEYSIFEDPSSTQLIDHKCIVPRPDEIYGPEYAGSIWVFHNRFLPVKFIITILAHMMIEADQKWISFERVKTEIGWCTEYITQRLSKINFKESTLKLTTGFPSTSEKFEQTPKLKKMRRGRREDRARELEIGSKNRFLDQFFGRELKPDGGRRVAGACFEMGLIDAGASDHGDSRLQVTLSKLGVEFLALDWTKLSDSFNPIFEQLWNNEKLGTPIQNIFSELEVDFILQKIIPRFKLEALVVDTFLGLSEETTVKELEEIFLDIQKQYLEEKKGIRRPNEMFPNLQKNGLARATSIMIRLVELGKVKRIKRGLSVSYVAN